MRGPGFSARAWLSGSRADLLVACALWVLGFSVGSWYMAAFNRIGGVADFGQPEFGAAVALACGKGFGNLGYHATPGLAAFLARESDGFSCDELDGVATGELNITQRLYRYLMSAVALVWSVRGVSWSRLWPLFGVLFGSTIAAAYGLFRLGIGRPLAVTASLALTVSSIHLGRLPYLRDYAKAPFMLALLLVLARMAVGPVTPRRIIGYGMAFGTLLGIGFGFRNDLMINVPAFVAVVSLCLPGKILANLRVKAAAIVLAALMFVVSAWPIVRAYRGGSNTGHVAVLGLMTPFDRPLGIGASLYDWGYAYVDQFVGDIVNSFSQRVGGRQVEFFSPEYDREATAYLLRVARHWPADMLARAYASVLNVLEMPFTVGTYASSIPYGAGGEWVRRLYDWQIWLLFNYLSGRGLLLTALALTIIAVRSPSTAAILLAFLIYYAGYPAIQFDVRHFFHLEFIAWWALAYALQRGVALASPLARGDTESLRAAVRDRLWVGPSIRMAAFTIVSAAVVLGSLTTLRAYQTPHVRSMLREYLAAPRQRLDTEVTVHGERVFVASPGLWTLLPAETPSMPVRTRYLVAEFSPATCDAAQLPVTFRYWSDNRTGDFSRAMVLTLMSQGGPTRIFFPAYCDRSWSTFEGPSGSCFERIELPRGHAACLSALYRVTDLERCPLLLGITFAPAWEQAAAFQTIMAFERPEAAERHSFYTVPRELAVPRSALENGIASIGSDITERAAIAAVTPDGGLRIRGRPEVPQSTLVRFRPRAVARHAMLIAEGELRTGGVSFDLVAAGRRPVRAPVAASGPFVVAVQAPEAGDFAVTIANDVVAWWPASRIGHRVGPLVEWIPGVTLWTDLVVKRIGWSTADADRAGARQERVQ